jgi:hypothetical protein
MNELLVDTRAYQQSNKISPVAEFKLSYWAGADAIRKRECSRTSCTSPPTKSDRRAQPFVVGEAPN